jgi:hypothetical protein
MKKQTLFLTLLISFLFINCGSKSNYTKNTLNKGFYENKTIYFTLNSKSLDKMSFKGPRMGVEVQPNVKKVFKESIEELALETKLNLKFVETPTNISNTEVLVDVEITEILWSFGLSVATMNTSAIYKTQADNKVYNIKGIRKSGGGAENNNLRKSLKNATYNFLKELEK